MILRPGLCEHHDTINAALINMDACLITRLCMSELLPIIESGDFRNFGAAEKIVRALAASSASGRNRSIRLHQLVDDLARVTTDRPECIRLLRALRAVVLRRLEESFVLRRLMVANALAG